MKMSSSLALLVFFSLLLAALAPGRAQAAERRYKRTVEKYVVPDVTLINQNREKIKLAEILNADKAVLLDFIYGTCTTICPVLSAGFSNMQRKLGADSDKVQMISISIDPEYDTPEVMAEYLARYRAKPGWMYLTGAREDINQVMHAFDAYVQDKMSHYPITFLRAPGDTHWVRIYGLIGTKDLLKEYEQLKK